MMLTRYKFARRPFSVVPAKAGTHLVAFCATMLDIETFAGPREET